MDTHLTAYTREILTDVAEAKRIGGKRLWHFPSEGRVRAADMRTAATQLLPYGIHGYRNSDAFHVSW